MRKKPIKDLIQVLISNIFILLSGFLVSFFLPKMMGYDGYGMYKTFTLYTTYSALLQVGYYEGMYLKYSGKNIEELDEKRFRTYFKFFALLQLAVFVIFLVLVFVLFRNELLFVFICVAIYAFIYNIASFFQVLSQMILRFSELSKRNIIKSVLNSLIVGGMIIVYYFSNELMNYRIYVILFLLMNLILCIWYLFTYRKLVFGPCLKISEVMAENKEFYRLGIPLLFSNLSATLILTLDRQFVNVLWPVSIEDNTYSIYAFAYNLLSLVTTLTSAMSLVLFPNLKKMKLEENIKDKYNKFIFVFIPFIFAAMLSFYPIALFVEWFLPKYIDSIKILYVIYPGLALTSTITVIMQNFYKLEQKNNIYFIKCIITLLISVVLNIMAYLIFNSSIAISWASIITTIIWFIISDIRYINTNVIFHIKVYVFCFINMICFYLLNYINNYYLEFVIYAAFVLTSFFVIFPKRVVSFWKTKMK